MSTMSRFIRRIIGKPSKNAQWVDGPLTYNQDGLATKHNCDFRDDPRFARAYQAGAATGSWGKYQPEWRAYVVCWAASHGMKIDGDFVECGVNRGGNALAVLEYTGLERSGKRFFLLDTFRGLVEDMLTPQEQAQGVGTKYEECYDEVRRLFADYRSVRLVRGAVPDTLGKVDAEQIAFLSIDMNCVKPEIAAAEHFWDRLSSGAFIVLDDYGFAPRYQQKIAFDQFARRRGVSVLALPTGQGIIVKP